MRMNLVLLATGAVGLSLPSFGVENLVKNGDMNDEKAIVREVTCPVGKMSVGVEDVKYLKLLRMVGGDDPVVQDFLKAAAKRVTDNPTGGDRRLADRVRDEAAALILKKISR